MEGRERRAEIVGGQADDAVVGGEERGEAGQTRETVEDDDSVLTQIQAIELVLGDPEVLNGADLVAAEV